MLFYTLKVFNRCHKKFVEINLKRKCLYWWLFYLASEAPFLRFKISEKKIFSNCVIYSKYTLFTPEQNICIYCKKLKFNCEFTNIKLEDMHFIKQSKSCFKSQSPHLNHVLTCCKSIYSGLLTIIMALLGK